jgi:2-dehydropantoate 2-reductase
MRVRIIGAGSLGLLFGGKLAAVCPGVELVARSSRQSEALQREGVHIVKQGAVRIARPTVLDSRTEIKRDDREIDFLILMVKQTSVTPMFAKAIRRQMTAHTYVVCFQNGIGHIDILAREIPRERIITAVTTEAALKLSDHAVEHTGEGITWIGTEAPQSDQHGEICRNVQKKLIHLLCEAGFNTSASNNIIHHVWQKLIVNSIINPLTAILRIRNGELLRQPESMELMKALLQEASELVLAKGIVPPGPTWEQLKDVCEKTSPNQSSMLQDIIAGRPTEIDRITGSLLQEAQLAGIAMPVHATIYRMVKTLEAVSTYSLQSR